MPLDATCPQCQLSFPVTEARDPFTVACPRCDAEMTVEFKKPSAPPEAGQPHYDLLVKPGGLDSTAPPTAPKKRKDVEDEEDEPRTKGGSALIVALSGGFGLLVVLGGLGLTAWVLFGLIDTTPSATPNRTQAKTNPPNAPNRPNPGPNVTQPNVPQPNAPRPDPFNPPKPKDTFDLRPVNGPHPPILPPALPADPSFVDLNGKAGALAVGGGGRYLVLHFPDAGRLSVFDVNELRVTATVPADSGEVYLAAGLTKVVLGVPNARIFRVYNLPDLAKQYDASGPDGLHGLAMGSRTDGPLLALQVFGRVSLWNVGPTGVTEVEGSAGEPGVHGSRNGLRALPDGTAFSTFDGFHPDNKTTLLHVQGRRWKVEKDVAQVPFPGPDGHFYGNGAAVTKAGQNYPVGGIGAGSNVWFVPSVSSRDYFLSVAPATVGQEPRTKRTLTVRIHKGRNANALAPNTLAVTGLEEFEGLADGFGGAPPVPYDQHFFLVPEAKLLLTLTKGRDRLVLRRVEPR